MSRTWPQFLARGKRSGFSPWAASRHRSRTRVPTDFSATCFSSFSTVSGLGEIFCPFFHCFWDRTSPRSEIGQWIRTMMIRQWIKSDLRSRRRLISSGGKKFRSLHKSTAWKSQKMAKKILCPISEIIKKLWPISTEKINKKMSDRGFETKRKVQSEKTGGKIDVRSQITLMSDLGKLVGDVQSQKNAGGRGEKQIWGKRKKDNCNL